jgi:NAD(P)-dependent dehydrogenase (short-subunit alcohol dehydrogenase family)
MTDLRDKVVLITGANGGFGQEFVQQFLESGSRIIATDIDATTLEKTVDTICRNVNSGQVLQVLAADLSSYEGCEALFTQVKHVPDVLVNNAGIAMYGRFDEIPPDKWQRLLQVNLLSPMHLTSLFIPHMMSKHSGHIVNISSVAGWIGSLGLSPYSAAKFGLRGFSEGLHADFVEHNIKITAAYPFYSRTPILNSPRYGSLQPGTLPDTVTSDPKSVVSEIMTAVRNDKLHVFPDKTAKQIYWINRFAPWLIPILNRRLEKQVMP